MLNKRSNILDWPHASLPPEIWEPSQNLKSEVKNFILDFIHSFAKANNLKHLDQWVFDIQFVGGLTTNTYNNSSDADVHLITNLDKFIEIERPEMSKKEASDYLDEVRKQVDQVKAKITNTQHPIEIYFNTEFTPPVSTEWSGIYSILNDEWKEYPHIVDQNFDIEKLHPELLELAKETASELDEAFGEVKRDVADIKNLQETIESWPETQRGSFEKKLQSKLDNLEKEIKELVDLREDVAEKRKHYKALSEQEVRFKYLQKYFYMHVLTDLKTLLKQSPELSEKDIPVVENIMSQSSLNIEALNRGNSAWISPEGTVFLLRDSKTATHADWLDENYKWLHKKYGFTIDNSEGAYDDYDPNSFCGLLVAEGWSRVGDIENVTGTGIEVPDVHNIPTAVFDFVLSNLKSPTEKVTFEDSEDNYVTLIQDEIAQGQKAVNRALQQKRMQTAALSKTEAGYKNMSDEEQNNNVIMIDFDNTIAHEHENKTIGEPFAGVQKAIQKFMDDGYYVVIDSSRANEKYGEDQIKEFMDKHNIPYDEIYKGTKPLAWRYIDNSAIMFTTWNDVLKQVEKAETEQINKKCSLSSKYWIDPSGKEYSFSSSDSKIGGHYGWTNANKKLLKETYGFEFPDEYWEKSQGLEEIADTMLKNGWTRITTGYESSDESDFAVEVASMLRLPSYLDDFIAKHFEGKGVEIDDLGANYTKVTNPFPSIQKAVNKELRHAVTAALRLPIIDPKTLNRKEPYALYIGTQMFSKKEGLDLFDVFGEHPMITEHNRVPTVTLDTLIKENIPVIGKAPRAGDKQPIQDLSRVIKTAALPTGNWAESAWISPAGKVFDLKGSSHEDAIVELIDDPKIYEVEDPNIYAISKGWTRFGEMGGGFEAGANVKNLRNINTAVFNHAIKYTGKNKEMVIADLSGKYVKMPVDEFVLGQKEVNKAIQREEFNKPKESNMEFIKKNYPEFFTKDNPFIDYFWDRYRGKISHFDDLNRDELLKTIEEYKSTIKTTAQLGSEYDFSSTQFNLPKELSERIIRWAVENITEDQIVHDSKDPGTKGIQLDSHITLKYGLKTNDFEKVKKALEGEKSPHVKFNKTSFFEPKGKDYDVVIVKVESDDLQKLHEKLCSQVEHEDLQFKEYHPHVTVAYVKKGLGKTYDGKDILNGEELYLDKLTFSPKQGEKRELELKKSASLFRIGDIVKDSANNRIGRIIEMQGYEVVLEEI